MRPQSPVVHPPKETVTLADVRMKTCKAVLMKVRSPNGTTICSYPLLPASERCAPCPGLHPSAPPGPRHAPCPHAPPPHGRWRRRPQPPPSHAPHSPPPGPHKSQFATSAAANADDDMRAPMEPITPCCKAQSNPWSACAPYHPHTRGPSGVFSPPPSPRPNTSRPGCGKYGERGACVDTYLLI